MRAVAGYPVAAFVVLVYWPAMSTAVLKVRLSIDGRPLPGFPLIQTLTLDGPIQQSVYNLGAAEAYADAAIPDVGAQALFHVIPLTRGPITARFGGQTAGGVEVNRRGLLLAFRCALTAIPKIQNSDLVNATGVLVAGGKAAA